MVPTINGKLHHFGTVGVYDGMSVMQDQETKTLWNHMSGEALYGPLVGHTLGPLSNLLQVTVKQALVGDANVRVAISDRPYAVGGRLIQPGGRGARGRGIAPGRSAARTDPNATLLPGFVKTLAKEDTRRPRMDLGLGVWTNTTRRYYPMEIIRQRGGIVIDRLDGRTLLVYIDPETFTPAAMFVNSTTARVRDKEVHLDAGRVVRSGVLFGLQGQRLPEERPLQVFTRWYGFALTFPGTQVFGQ